MYAWFSVIFLFFKLCSCGMLSKTLCKSKYAKCNIIINVGLPIIQCNWKLWNTWFPWKNPKCVSDDRLFFIRYSSCCTTLQQIVHKTKVKADRSVIDSLRFLWLISQILTCDWVSFTRLIKLSISSIAWSLSLEYLNIIFLSASSTALL